MNLHSYTKVNRGTFCVEEHLSQRKLSWSDSISTLVIFGQPFIFFFVEVGGGSAQHCLDLIVSCFTLQTMEKTKPYTHILNYR